VSAPRSAPTLLASWVVAIMAPAAQHV
jgi:hypothetical protein